MVQGLATSPQGRIQMAGQVVLEARTVLWHLAEAPKDSGGRIERCLNTVHYMHTPDKTPSFS